MLINKDWITDKHCADIIARNDTTEFFNRIDNMIISQCAYFGIQQTDIHVDGSGYITSTALKEYAINEACYSLLRDYWGSSHGTNDIYYEKMMFYKDERDKAQMKLTYENILNNQNLSKSSFIGEAPIY